MLEQPPKLVQCIVCVLPVLGFEFVEKVFDLPLRICKRSQVLRVNSVSYS